MTTLLGLLGICGRLQPFLLKSQPSTSPGLLLNRQTVSWQSAVQAGYRETAADDSAAFFFGPADRLTNAGINRTISNRILISESTTMTTTDVTMRNLENQPSHEPHCPSPGTSTKAVHAGEARQKPADAITDGIYCASTYTFADTQAILDFIEQQQTREEYGRYGNPGTRVVEKKLASLEGAQRSVLFGSGMSAIVGLLSAILKAGDEVIFFDECYHRTREYCSQHLSRFGVVTKQVKTGDYEAMEAGRDT